MKYPQFGWFWPWLWLAGRAVLLGGGIPVLAIVALAASASLPSNPTTLVTLRPQTSAHQSQLTLAQTRFGFQLFAALLPTHTHQNLFISPTSVAIALSMLYNGATGETQQAIAKTLEITEISLDEVNQANAALLQSLQTDSSSVHSRLVNSLWADQRLPLQPTFVQRMQADYQARVSSLDFRHSNAVATINHWVKTQTEGHIPQIINQIQADEALFLLNAIYFKGQWAIPFDPTQTRDHPFTLPNGQQRSYPFMAQTGTYRYYETPTFQAVSIPYGDGRFSFDIFLPSPTMGLAGFYRELNAENWRQWTQQMERRPGHLSLPRLRLASDVTLNEALQALGMGIAFDRNRANFAQLTPQPAYVSRVKHKTFVEVNEEGAEAAGTTAIGLGVRSAALPAAPFTLVVDRPFFCVIQEHRTGTLLFMGAIVNPMAP